jgi:hypothetical protein
VVNEVLLNVTTELAVKLDPETVSVVAGEPTVTVDTEIDEIAGAPELDEPPPQPNEAMNSASMNPTTTARR